MNEVLDLVKILTDLNGSDFNYRGVYVLRINGTDSDSDGLSDGEEVLGWAFKTNPLSADSDHDFLSDSAETKTFSAKIDARRELNVPVSLPFAHDCVKASSAQLSFALSYGEATADYGIQTVPDVELYITKKENNLLLFNQTYNDSRYVSEVLDLVKILTELNVSDFNYRGEYVLRINNTNAGCLLEQFELEVAAYLDPNDADFDNDGLMDGVETSGYVEGSSVIDFADSYGYGNLTTCNGTENAAWEAFSLEIPYVGRVTDASLVVNVSSVVQPIGLGNIAIKLVKRELNETLTDPTLINFNANFYDDHAYSWIWELDLGAYLANGTIFELYGKYDLQIKVVQTTLTNNTLDNFTISNYSITTDGWRAPESDETWGWVTDPTTPDTDGDSWSDSYEVFTKGTNPLSPDTDADGAWDANDRDPLRDLVLEIELKEGYHGSLQWWEHTPELQICVSFKLGSKDYFFATEPEKATESANQYGSKRKALFDSTYYVNVNDKLSAQGNEVALKFELWHEGPKDYCGKSLWDTRLLRDSYDYSIGTSGHSSGTETLEEGDHYLKFEVSTLGIERANTVAVHENGTVFNGHYAAQEKVSVVKFELTEDGDNTPFVSGDNVIITPTSLFTSTSLNAKLQHQQQDETPLSGAGFGSIDRDEGADSDGATDEVDFFYDAGELTSEEAMELLNQILEFVAGDDGNYSGTYSFENDTIGSLPIGWTNSSTNGTITEVIEEKDGHNTVLQLTDNLSGCENRTNVYTNFTAQTYGAIEGWLYVDEGSAQVCLGENDNIILTFNNTGLYCTNNTATILASANDYTNEWHHYRVEFECGSESHYNLSQGEYRIYLDNESIGEYLAKSGTNNIAQFGFSTWTTNDTIFYVDAIGFSWDANYAIGENYNCGNVTDFYAYASTKLDDFSPCLMNLPADSLKLIVWVRDYENSDQGKKPQDFGAYVEQWWASVWDSVQEEFQKVVDNLVMFFLESFPWAWLLIRAALLLFILIEYTFFIVMFLILFSLISIALTVILQICGGSIELDGLELKYINLGQEMVFSLETEWNYNAFFDLELPECEFSIKLNELPIFSTISGIISFVNNLEILGVNLWSSFSYSSSSSPNSNPWSNSNSLPPLLSSNPFQYGLNFDLLDQETNNNIDISSEEEGDIEAWKLDHKWISKTDYGAIIVGGGWDSENEYLDDPDGDHIPLHYDVNNWDPNDYSSFNNNESCNDDDNDGISDFNEFGPYNSTAITHYLLSDSDFDGLNDGWEIEHMYDFDKDHPLNASSPDIIVEVDYLEKNKPITKEVEEFSLIVPYSLYIAAMVSIAVAAICNYNQRYKTASSFCVTAAGLTIAAITTQLMRPREPFEPIKQYFRECGVNLLICLDNKIDTNNEGITTEGECDLIEDSNHNIYESVYSLFVNIHESEEDGFVGGQASAEFGAVVSAGLYSYHGSGQQQVFGHELFHCLWVNMVVGNEPYSKDLLNYMSDSISLTYQPDLYIEDGQWGVVQLDNKYSVEGEMDDIN